MDMDNSLTIPESYATTRRALPARGDHHKPAEIRDGIIRQLGVLDQFNDRFVSISTSFGGPGAICGYVVCASVLVLENYFRSRPAKSVLTELDILEIRRLLCDVSVMDAPLRQAFQEIQGIRRSFVQKYNASVDPTFAAPLDMADALRQWVANYELGDFLIRHSTSPATVFFRVNEYLDIHEATPDHRPRLEKEDAQFGGRRGAGGEPIYAEHESIYFMQRFGAHAGFVSPSDWRCLPGDQTKVDDAGTRIIALDLAGHFVTAIACMLQVDAINNEDPTTPSVQPALIVFNSTHTSYLLNSSVAYAFDTFF